MIRIIAWGWEAMIRIIARGRRIRGYMGVGMWVWDAGGDDSNHRSGAEDTRVYGCGDVGR